jgi:pseudouridine synthase
MATTKAVKAPAPGDRPLKTLERVLSKAGVGSRSEARRFVGAGRVQVNGAVVTDPDQWVDLERDEVTFDGKPLAKGAPRYLLLNKPTGYLTTARDPHGRATIYDLLPETDSRLIYVGRLDYDTSGLLILTNDTAFAERLMNPAYKVPKTYLVESSTPLTEVQLDRLRNGIELEDGPTRPALVTRRGETTFELTISEGRNRQVRRMIDALGAEVITLQRIAIGTVTLSDLAPGTTRDLTGDERQSLM